MLAARRAVCLGAVVALLIIAAAVLWAAPRGAKEGYRGGRYRDSRYRWVRDPWRPLAPARAPPMWWFGAAPRRYGGYAAPLELSLPFQSYYDYLYGYPPSARMPYNA